MRFKTGFKGITKMYNIHTKEDRQLIVITGNERIEGIISSRENIISLGYNETIECEDKACALDLMESLYQFLK
jgi:hypothetical protein